MHITNMTYDPYPLHIYYRIKEKYIFDVQNFLDTKAISDDLTHMYVRISICVTLQIISI